MTIVKEIKIFDVILHAKVAWEAIDPETIAKCFRYSGIQENYDSPPSTPEFADYFKKCQISLGRCIWSWMRNWESEEPTRAPNRLACNDDNNEEISQDKELPAPIKPDEALNYLHQIQKSNLGDTKLFDILEQAMSLIQYKKIVSELSSKTKQTYTKKFFSF